MTGYATPEQKEWVAILNCVTGIVAAVWRPSDAVTILKLLNGEPDIIMEWKSSVNIAGERSRRGLATRP